MSKQQRQREADRLHRLHVIVAVGLLPLAALAVWHHVRTRPVDELKAAGDAGGALVGKLDPNTAPWWELTVLPGIGETKAKAMVEYRTQVRTARGEPNAIVFRNAEDLQAVKGVGPKTAARIAPYLKFPPG